MSKRKYVTRLLCSAFASVALSGNAYALKEADKSEAVKRIMKSRTFHNRAGTGFCKEFLKDFSAQKGIEYVEPKIRTDDYENPALDPYKNACPDLKLNETFECERGALDDLEDSSPSGVLKQARTYCRSYYGTSDFKLYELELDESSEGKETVFYYERKLGPQNMPGQEKRYGPGGYNVFNLSQCEGLRSSPTKDPYDYYKKRPLENYNAVIRYQGEIYIFDLHVLQPGSPHYTLNIDGKREKGRGGGCYFSTWTVDEAIETNSKLREKQK